MNKNQLICLAVFMAISSFANAQFGKIKVNTKTVEAGTKVVKAATLSDEDVIKMTDEYMDWMDKHNPVATGKDPYAVRLKKIVDGLKEIDGLKLNIKAYKVIDVNAFACANGDVRVLAGLMDLMTDDEIRAVIGHEMGHVANHDTKDAMRTAYLTSAAKDAVASQGGAAASLSESQLGALAEALANAQFSQKQETEADNYGFEFLKRNGYNLEAMGSAFRKLEALAKEAGGKKGKQIFSSHPDTKKRAERMEKRAKEEGGK